MGKRVLGPGFPEPRGRAGGALESEGLRGGARKSSQDPRERAAPGAGGGAPGSGRGDFWGRRVGQEGVPGAARRARRVPGVGAAARGGGRGEFQGATGARGSAGGGRPLAAAHHDGSGPGVRKAGARGCVPEAEAA